MEKRTSPERTASHAVSLAWAGGDGVTLRTLLRKKTGRGIRELRAAYA